MSFHTAGIVVLTLAHNSVFSAESTGQKKENGKANQLLRVPSRIGGIVKEVRVKVGQHVDKGDVLVMLDDRFAKLEVELTKQRVKKAKVRLEASVARLEELQKKQGKLRWMQLKGYIPLSVLSAVEDDLSDVQKQIPSLKIAVEIRKFENKKAILTLEAHQITAPFAGEVSRIHRQAGEAIGEYQTIVTMKLSVAQQPKKQPFKWVNPFPKGKYPGLRHGTFHSTSMKVDAGYCVYLPPGYDNPKNKSRRYPVVYWLHGGRPGSETKVIHLAPFFDKAIRDGQVPPMIYVFPNGGIVSHYDYPKLKSLGETAFIKELIPHIDKTYRTIASRDGRAIEGFSQGGRGTARYMFKYPHLFCSAAPMGGGHQHEKRISENNGDEGKYEFKPKNNSYDLARKYAVDSKTPLKILVVVGDKDKNYQPNLDWMNHLRSLKIPFEHRIVKGVGHNARMVYERVGLDVMRFHAANFKKAE